MAESAASQAQAEVTERRLRPLYDALDYGQHKKALQIADKILKKQKDLKCARVLKAIALLRLSRGEEANELVESVLATHPGDQATLQALTLFYRETGDFQRIAKVYSDAAKHYPKNQEILTHLFMAYVRVGDCQKQQQVAAQLSKAFPKNGPYQCWRVMSVLMQADEPGNVELAKAMYLPLADKLIGKYFKDVTVEAEAEVRLYMMVLDKLGATGRKLQLLESSDGKRIRDQWERDSLIVTTLQSLGRYEEAGKKLVAMIETNPDSWFAIKAYIDCQVERSLALHKKISMETSSEETGATSNEGETPANQPEAEEAPANQNPQSAEEGEIEDWLRPLVDARDLLDRLSKVELKKFEAKEQCVRGPLLGRMELLLCVKEKKVPRVPITLGGACDMLMDYFRLFGTKNCVFDDIMRYISPDGLAAGDVEKFVKEVDTLVTSQPVDFDCPPEDVKENLSRMRRHITLLQLQRYIGCHEVPVQRKLELVAMCLHHYRQGLKLGGEFSETASQPADFYMVLAAHLKMEVYHETGDARHVWEGVMILEGVRNHSTQKSLLLMKLYGHLGVTEAITDIYNSITIKHIQTETLGFIPSRYLQSMGTFGFANQLYRGAFRFFFQSSKEVSEYTIQCFKNGMFHKIPEMLRLRDRLTHSFNFASIMVDMNILELLTTVNSFSEAVTFFNKEWRKGMAYTTSSLKDYCSRLIDSRDFAVLEDWSSPSMRLAGVETKITFDLECLWLRTRICVMKSAHAVLTCLTSEEATKEEVSPINLLSQQVEELSGTLESMDQHVGTLLLKQRSKYQLHPIQAPPPCLGYVYYQEGHGGVFSQMLCGVRDLLAGASSIKERLQNILARLQTIKSRIKGPSLDLREAMMKVVSPTTQDGDGDEGIVVASPFDTEHPYDIITRSRIDLEEYVLFLQTLSHLSLLCTMCAEHLAPTFSGGKRKKKKKATEQSPTQQHPVSSELVDFMKELLLLLTSTSVAFQPFSTPRGGDDALVQQLSELYISHSPASLTGAAYTQLPDNQDPHFKAWREGVARACGAAVSSYNMSFRDTLEVVTAKLQSLRSAIKQLGGHVD